VRIYDCNLDSDNPYYVMEYCSGGSLEHMLQKGAMSPSAVLRTIWPVCAALDHAHSQGVLHRDIKPGNVLFGADGRPRLSDFGMCRIADWHTLTCGDDSMLGTLYYLPPEQSQDPSSVDARSDIFAFGRTLRHMLTGSAMGTTLPSSVASSERRRREMKAWDHVVTKLTALDRSGRPRSMRHVAVLLDRIGDGHPLGRYAREMRRALLSGEARERQPAFSIPADEFSRIVTLVGLTGFGEMRHFRGPPMEPTAEHRRLLSKYGQRLIEAGTDGPLAALVLLSTAGRGRGRPHLSTHLLLEAQRVALRTTGRHGVDFIRHEMDFYRHH
jgi:serine/threonine protein kinase